MTWPVDKDRLGKGLYWQRAWTLVEGCTPVSPGCDNCWSASQTRLRVGQKNPKICGPKQGVITDGCFNGTIKLREDNLDKPVKAVKPTSWAVWNDLFHPDVPSEFIMEALDVMSCVTPECGKRHKHEEDCWTGDPHTFLVLTKRIERMLKWFTEEQGLLYWPGDSPANIMMFFHWPPQNVFFGTTIENQEQADLRLPYIKKLKEAFPSIRLFVSIEPMLSAVDIRPYLKYLDWVVLGGESGPKPRPMYPDWARKVRDDCEAAGVAFFFKSHGVVKCKCYLNAKAAARASKGLHGGYECPVHDWGIEDKYLLDGREHKNLPLKWRYERKDPA